MEKFSRESLKNIQAIVQDKTGAEITRSRGQERRRGGRMALVVVGLLFFVSSLYFAFRQEGEWFPDPEIEQRKEVEQKLFAKTKKQDYSVEAKGERRYDSGTLVYPDWSFPTGSNSISGRYGARENGIFADHINIAGEAGEEVYAVADGVVAETAFDSVYGNVVGLDLGAGVVVRYGHLEEIKVNAGDEIKQGQVIATMGKTGMATGPNLSLTVTVDGETIDPLTDAAP